MNQKQTKDFYVIETSKNKYAFKTLNIALEKTEKLKQLGISSTIQKWSQSDIDEFINHNPQKKILYGA